MTARSRDDKEGRAIRRALAIADETSSMVPIFHNAIIEETIERILGEEFEGSDPHNMSGRIRRAMEHVYGDVGSFKLKC